MQLTSSISKNFKGKFGPWWWGNGVSSISTPTRPKGRVGLDLAPWSGGAQPTHGWWTLVAYCYIEEVGVTARGTRLSAPPQTPPTTLAIEGALEWREASPSPPWTSCFITRTQCHRPHLRHFPNAAFIEPASSLPPLRQAEEAPATSTEEMANPPAAPSSLVDGRCPPTPFLSVVVSLCVVVMSQIWIKFMSFC
jgi:hypothetical protein